MPRQSTAPPTIVSLKQQWLSTQMRLLSTDLAPSKDWRAANEDDGNEENRTIGLPDKAVDDAIWALNHRVQQHAKRVYSRQATRHVAEQIDQLYWDASNRAADRASGEGEGNEEEEDAFRGLNYGADLVDPKIISSLPASWSYDPISTRQAESHPAEAAQYSELVSQLRALSSQRAEVAARVSRLRRMRALLDPFDTSSSSATNNNPDKEEEKDQGQVKLQDNLITRNGEIEKELQRMRMLLARVGGRVDQLQQQKEQQQQQQRHEKGMGKGKRKRNQAGDEAGQSEDENRMVIDFSLDENKKLDELLKGF